MASKLPLMAANRGINLLISEAFSQVFLFFLFFFLGGNSFCITPFFFFKPSKKTPNFSQLAPNRGLNLPTLTDIFRVTLLQLNPVEQKQSISKCWTQDRRSQLDLAEFQIPSLMSAATLKGGWRAQRPRQTHFLLRSGPHEGVALAQVL